MNANSYQQTRKDLKAYLWDVLQNKRTGFLPNILKVFLWLCSLCYGVLVRLVSSAYQFDVFPRVSLPRPVISVGNLTFGGAGKTPLVVEIANYVLKQGLTPAVLTRGYHSREGAPGNDEVLLLQRAVPQAVVGVGSDRVLSAQKILRDHPRAVFIMDDGFQHWRLKRDLDIVCLDAGQPFGNGFLLPRGMLREPKSAISRADLVVLTKTDQPGAQFDPLKQWLQQSCRAPVASSVHEPLEVRDLVTGDLTSINSVAGKRVCALCSIGRPESFIQTLEALQAQVACAAVFMDHDWYSAEEINKVLANACGKGAELILTTEKDAVKLEGFKEIFEQRGLPCRTVRMKLTLTEGQEGFYRGIDRLLQR